MKKSKMIDVRLAAAYAAASAFSAPMNLDTFGDLAAGIQIANRSDPVFAGPSEEPTVNADLQSADAPRIPLQAFATAAYGNDDLNPLIEFLTPNVPVTTDSLAFSYYDRSGGINELNLFANLERAINGVGQSIDGKGVWTPLELTPHALVSEIDEDRFGGPVGAQVEARNRITSMINLANLYMAYKGYAAINAVAANTAKTWDATAGKNPDGDVREQLTTGQLASGFRANRVLYGSTAWNYRTSSHENQASAGGFSAAARTMEALATYLQVQGVRIDNSITRDNAGALSALIGDKVLMFKGNAGAGMMDDSTAKLFWSPDNGQRIRTHMRQISEKVWRVAITWKAKIAITGVTGTNSVRKFTVSNA